MELMRKSV